MDELDVEQELLEDEWLEEEPILTTKNVGVVCDDCGGVALMKYHMARSGFSFSCNKCRVKASRTKAQRRYAAKHYRSKLRESAARVERLLGRVDRHAVAVASRVEAYEAKANDPTFAPSHSQKKTYEKNVKLREFLVSARMKMLEDLLYTREKPYEDYMKEFGDKNGTDTGSEGEDQDQAVVEELRA